MERIDLPSRAFVPVSFLIALGVFVSGELTVSHLLHLDAPCFAGSNCSDLAGQADAYVWGVPLALYGLAMYVALWILHVAGSVTGSQAARLATTAISACGTCVSWYLIAKAHAAGIFCAWCLTSAFSVSGVLLLSPFLLKERPRPRHGLAWTYAQLVVACLAIVALKPTINLPDEKLVADTAVLAATPLRQISPADRPSYGKGQSDYVLVMFVDFACSGCRASLQNASARSTRSRR